MNAIFDYKLDPADDLYAIVGCDELSSAEQILAEYRIRAVNCHPDKNRHDPKAVDKFQRLQRAKEILTDEKSRLDYDTWRRSGISLPYEEWIARKDSIKMSMHWAMKTKQEPAIESCAMNGASGTQDSSSLSEGQEPRHLPCDSQENTIESRVFWSRNDASDLLNKFRNYEI